MATSFIFSTNQFSPKTSKRNLYSSSSHTFTPSTFKSMATRQPHRQHPKQPPQQQQQQNTNKVVVVVVAEKRKPVFVKVDQLKPGTNGHTLVVKVLESKTVLQKGRADSQHLRQTRIAECLIGDETGAILFTARNDQEQDCDKEVSAIVYGAWLRSSSAVTVIG